MSQLKILDKLLGPIETRALLLWCPITREAVIVDPSFYSFRQFIPFIEEQKLQLKGVFLTHSHWDHIVDIAKFRDQGIDIYVHPLDRPNVMAPGVDGLRSPKSIEGVSNPKDLVEGDQFTVGAHRFIVIETPGHSPGSVCFYCAEQKLLISGDTLFQGSIGRTDFPTSRPDLMQNSLEKIGRLPKETIVYPGHGPTTILMEEL